MGCMATKETICTWRRRQIRLQWCHSEWVLHLFGWRRHDKNNIVATGWPSLHGLSAAFVYIFCYLLKCHLLLNFNKICSKMALSCLRHRQIRQKMHRRLFLIFMMWKIYCSSVRSVWVHPINTLRLEKGEFYTLYPDLRHFNPKFFAMYRMNPAKFNRLLGLVGPKLQKKWTKFRNPLSPEQKLVITLR